MDTHARPTAPNGPFALELTSTDPATVADGVLAVLELAWNTADGEAYGAPFAADADVVDIRGDRHHGRQAIAAAHTALFADLYVGSTVRYDLDTARVTSGVVLAHVRARLACPNGPLAGRSESTASAVIVPTPEGWQVVSFHSTLRAD